MSSLDITKWHRGAGTATTEWLVYQTLRRRICQEGGRSGHSSHQDDTSSMPGCLACWEVTITLAEAGMLVEFGGDKHYSAALDEIYRQRMGAAHECSMLDWILDFRTLPMGARKMALKIRQRLQLTAQGKVDEAYEGLRSQTDLEAVDAPLTLTRPAWEARDRG